MTRRRAMLESTNPHRTSKLQPMRPLGDRRQQWGSIRSRARWLIGLVICIMCSGCLRALHPLIGPTTTKLHLKAPAGAKYTVRVNVDPFPVFTPDATGRVVAEVPRFGRTCSTYFLFIPIEDQRPEHLPVVEVRSGDHTVRQLSLAKIRRLKTDSEGYSLVYLR
jgi:hypothetical protein